jgi:hypothetical protein
MNIQTEYSVSFGVYAKAGQQGTIGNQVSTDVIKDSEGDSYEIEYMKKTAQKILTDGSKSVLDYTFRSSAYNKFEQKLSALNYEAGSMYIDTEVRVLLLASLSNFELFDAVELTGNSYTGNKPLVSVEAILDDYYYLSDIFPIVYKLNTVNSSIQISRRDAYGVPPKKAFTLYDNSDLSKSRIIPFVYELPFYYRMDYIELKDKVKTASTRGTDVKPYLLLINSYFPYIRKGYYKAKYNYTLPSGIQGSSKQLNYEWKF